MFASFFNRKVLIFFIITLLLLVTALIRLPCPVCHGSGVINDTPGSENVRIDSLSYVEETRAIDACGVYKVYTYSVAVELTNEGKEDVSGWIKLLLLDTSREESRQTVDTQYARMEVPALTNVRLSYAIVFGTGLDEANKAVVTAEVINGDVPDLTCEGRGYVSLNTWLFVDQLKENFFEKTRVESSFNPPVVIDWSDYYFDNES
jgi:hypothetical protein